MKIIPHTSRQKGENIHMSIEMKIRSQQSEEC